MDAALLRAGLLRLGVLLGFGGFFVDTITAQINVVWNGSVSSDWHTAANWSPPVVPELCSHFVIIPHTVNQPVVSTLVNVGRIQLADSVNLVLNADLVVCGDWIGPDTDEASITGTAKVVMDGFGQWIRGYTAFNLLTFRTPDTTRLDTGSHVDILYKLNLNNGVFDVTRGTLRFPSTSDTSYSILDNFSPGFIGKLQGSAIVERYVPVAGFNQHFFGTPIRNTTFAQMGASGTPGYIIPSYNCNQNYQAPNSPYGHIFQWHDDVPANATCLYNGWEVKTSGNAEPGRAYSTYLNGGLFTITGEINQDSDYTIAGLNNIGWSSNTFQTAGFYPPAYESGWHLVANPYLAPLQLDGHTPDFDAAAVWVTSGPFSGTYQPIAITGGTVPPFQGFVVHRPDPSAADFTFHKTECIDVTGQPFYKQTGATALSITVTGNGYGDVTYVRFDENATSGYDVNFDNRKPLSVFGQPTLYTYNSNAAQRLSVNVNRSIRETPAVHMNFIPGSNGVFTIHAAGITSFDPTSYIWLEDTKTGDWINLRQQSDYTFTSSTADAHTRFVLHFTPALEIIATDANCTAPGHLSIQQPGNTTWNYTISNNSAEIAQGVLSNGAPVALSLEPDVYTVMLSDADAYTVIKNILIGGVAPAEASISASMQTAEEGQEIVFAGPADAQICNWDFGDGIMEVAPVVTHTYSVEGIYDVQLSVTSVGNCTASATLPVIITAGKTTAISENDLSTINIYSVGNEVTVNFGELKDINACIQFYNLLGQRIGEESITRATIFKKRIPLAIDGYVVIQIKNNGNVLTEKLFLNNNG